MLPRRRPLLRAESSSGSCSVNQDWFESLHGVSFLVRREKTRAPLPYSSSQVALQADLLRPSEILVEDKATGRSLIQEIKTATSCPVIAIKVDPDKETRAAAVKCYFESGRVLFPEQAAEGWVIDLEDELASFPGGLHDDCVDAITQALSRLLGSGDELGLVKLIREMAAGVRDVFGRLLKPGPKPAEPAAQPLPSTSSKPKEETYRFCKKCKVELRPFGSSRAAGDLRCPQCSATYMRDGTLVSTPETVIIGVNRCENPLPQIVASAARCGSCGRQRTEVHPVGVSRPSNDRSRRLRP